MRFVGIDPGSESSAIVVYSMSRPGPRLLALPEHSGVVEFSAHLENSVVLGVLRKLAREFREGAEALMPLGVETSAARGAPLYDQHVRTFRWSGRFLQCWEDYSGVEGREVLVELARHHLTGRRAPSDAQIRAAMIDAHGGKDAAVGRKKAPGPLYGVSGHGWDALAVAWFLATT